MTFDALFLSALVLKMAITGCLVVVASYAAERGGPLIGAMVATLPISAGPVYVFLALEHDDAFVGASALASLVTNTATAIFSLVYAMLAQRSGTLVSVAGALAAWFAAVAVTREINWTLPRALLLTLLIFPPCLAIASSFRHATLRAPQRRWFDLPLRAGLVAILVSIVVTASPYVGAGVTGILALFPVVLTSLTLILHPRVGGRSSAAVIANAISGLLGFAFALAALSAAAVPLGTPAALALTLAISIAWNLMVFFARRRGIPL